MENNINMNAEYFEEYLLMLWKTNTFVSDKEFFLKEIKLEKGYYDKYSVDSGVNSCVIDGTVAAADKHRTQIWSQDLFVIVNTGNSIISVEVYCTKMEAFLEFEEKIKQKFKIVNSFIRWIYDSYNSEIIVPTGTENLPIEEMYPFLEGKTLAEYYQEFMDSSCSILLLIGPPGTGKTTFIRGLINYSNSSARVCYDGSILDKDGIFSDYIDSTDSFFVLEDSDSFLISRKEGNTMMHKFLNVGDGLVRTKGKKLIFSTNLPNISEIDPALIRPGRCFDILHFEDLSKEEAEILIKKIGSPYVPKAKNTIAEIYNAKQNIVETGSKVGFI